jgi:NSS family neurotransmitter:Na+ symporter
MEAIVSSFMDQFHLQRDKATVIILIYTLVVGVLVCLGYNKLYFELTLPNGATAQILDVLDYISNNILMPIVAIGTCLLIGWAAGPKTIIDEVTKNGSRFGRRRLYIVMIRFIAPVLLIILFLNALGILH